MVLLTARARRDEPEQPLLHHKEGLELPAGSKLQPTLSVVTVRARFADADELASANAAPANANAPAAALANAPPPSSAAPAPALAKTTSGGGGGAFFDTTAAAHAAVKGLGAEQEQLLLRRKKPQQQQQQESEDEQHKAKSGDFLRSASAYFGHEVPVAEPLSRFRRAAPDAVAIVDDDDDDSEDEKGGVAALKKKKKKQQQEQQQQQWPQSAAAAALLAAYDEPNKPYRKGLTAAEAPPYTTFPNITAGYRSGGTYLRCLASLFELHTETLNAWTTIIGNVISVSMLVRTLSRERVTSPLDAAPFLLMTFSGLLHAPFSTGFHLFRCMTPRVYNLWRRLDHVFIYVMCWPAVAALSWFVLPPQATLAAFLAAGVLAQRAAKGIWGLKPHVQRDRREIVRAAGEVGALVLLQFAPMVLQSVREVLKGTAASWPSAQGPGGLVVAGMLGVPASLLFAANVFASGVPERWAPGRFNYCGSSHQLMHVGVIGAVVSMYAYLTALLRHRVAAAEAQGLSALAPPLSAEGGGAAHLAAQLLGHAASAVGFGGNGGVVGGGAGLSGW